MLAAIHNARQFYDDASAVIPILLLAVIYQARTLSPTRSGGLAWGLVVVVINLALSALGEFECLRVASGYRPSEQGQIIVVVALALLGTLAIAEPFYRWALVWNDSRVSGPPRTPQKDKGLRAFTIAVLALAALSVGGALWLTNYGN